MPERNQAASHTISVSTATFVKAVAIVLGLWFLWYVRDIVAMVFSALLLAALIRPFADWFSARRIPRGLAVIIVYLALGVVAGAVIMLIVPVIVQQVTQLLGSGPLSHVLQETTERLTALFDVQHFLESLLAGQVTSVTAFFNQVTGFLYGFVALLVVLALAFYMVVEDDTAKKLFKNLAPVEYQPYLGHMLTKMQFKIGAWLRGQLLLGLLVGTASFVGLMLLGIKYALLLSVIAGLLEIIPYVGPTLSVIPAIIIGFVQSPFQGLAVLVLYVVIQQLENNIFVPKIMQKVTGLNPIVSIVALMVGIKLGGFLGAILSIPVATMAAVVLEDLFRPVDVT